MTERAESRSRPSLIGGASIIASVCVGAGMLGLPSSGAGAWTTWSSLALVLTMVVMTLSGWMLLEAFEHFGLRASFNTVTKSLLGSRVNAFSNLTRADFGLVVAKGGDVDVLLAALGFAINSERVATTISAFSTAAICRLLSALVWACIVPALLARKSSAPALIHEI